MQLFSVIGVTLIAIFAIAIILTVPLWFLWNWLMPELFGLQSITLLQALGLMLLSSILFKSSSTSSNS